MHHFPMLKGSYPQVQTLVKNHTPPQTSFCVPSQGSLTLLCDSFHRGSYHQDFQ